MGNNRYLLYGSVRYALGILRPLQDAARARGDEVALFFDGREDEGPNELTADECRLVTVEQVRQWNPTAVFTSSNALPHFFPFLRRAIALDLAHQGAELRPELRGMAQPAEPVGQHVDQRAPLRFLRRAERHAGMPGEVQQAVEQHRAVAGREDEPIAVGPVRIARVVRQELVPQGVGHVGGAHGQAGMARIGVLHRVSGEETNGIDGLTLKVWVWHKYS